MQRFFGQSGSGSGCSLLDQSGSRFTLQLLGQSGGFRLQIFWPIRRWMEAAAISANQHSADMTVPPVPPSPHPQRPGQSGRWQNRPRSLQPEPSDPQGHRPACTTGQALKRCSSGHSRPSAPESPCAPHHGAARTDPDTV